MAAAAPTDRRASWEFEPGTELGAGRTVVRLLGGGDRYEAWLGWDDHLAAPVVLKMLRPDHAPRDLRAIAREAASLRSLAHPGIVRCFGAELEDERPYLVLEFLDGPRLSTLLRRFGPLSPEQLVPLAVELSSALRYMHNEGLLHLDVKPQNVIMGAPPRLIDLSIARPAADVPTGPLGTEAYMAPEQADAERLSEIGTWTDVWGLGATLYEAANGHRPFARSMPGAPLAQLSEEPRPFHPRVPGRIVEVISRTLARQPAARPTLPELAGTFDEMLDDSRDVSLRRLRRRVR